MVNYLCLIIVHLIGMGVKKNGVNSCPRQSVYRKSISFMIFYHLFLTGWFITYVIAKIGLNRWISPFSIILKKQLRLSDL